MKIHVHAFCLVISFLDFDDILAISTLKKTLIQNHWKDKTKSPHGLCLLTCEMKFMTCVAFVSNRFEGSHLQL